MKTRTLGILAVIAGFLLLAGTRLYLGRAERLRADIPTLLYPGLIDRVDEIAHVRIVGPDGEFNIRRDDAGVWRLEEFGGYPSRTDYMRAAVLSLSDLTVLEGKTSKPENYAKLQVQDPGPDETSILIEMTDAEGQALVSIILGGIENGLMPTEARRYVRLTDNPRVLYVDGRAEVASTPMQWIDRQILMIPRALTHEVAIRHPDGAIVRLVRPTPDADKFVLANMPAGAQPRDDRDANLVGGAFIYVGLEEVAPMDTVDESAVTPGPVATLRTFDGYVMTARLFDYQGQTWVRFEASVGEPVPGVIDQTGADDGSADSSLWRTPEEIAALVESENARLAPFRFRMLDASTEKFTTRPSDLYDAPAAGTDQIGPQPDDATGAGDG